MTKKKNPKIKSSIRIKITFWAGLALVLVSIILIGFSVNTLRQSTIENSKNEAIAIAASKTGFIQSQLDLPRFAAHTLAQSFSAIKDQAIPTSLSREAANGMLRKVLISNPSFLGTYTIWEPNAFDGLDAEYIRAVAHDETGRFIPYWVRDAAGIIHTEALVQYEMPGVGDWYIVPRSTQKGLTIAPVISQIQEQTVVTASFIEPIIHNEQFYGVAGVDAPIGFVQQLVDEIDMYDGTTNAVLFTDDGTLIAARQQPEMVNQTAELIYPDFASFQDQLSTPLSRLSPDGKYLQIFSPLEVSEGTSRWVLGLIIPFEEITAPATNAAIRQVAISTIIIILSLIFLWLLAGQLVRPLRELTRAAESVSAGELDFYADIKSNDETEVLANAFNTMTARLREILADLEQRVAARTRDLGLAAEVGRRVSLVSDTDTVLTEAVNTIQERFDLYYTQVYLTDPTGRTLVLRAGTGDVGQTLLGRGHRLAIDMSSLNGIAATERRTVLVADTETSTIHRPNPLLPETRSEMAVPLVAGDRVVGVLDMQSSQAGTFSQENLSAFEALAGSLAIAISNANLFEQAEAARTTVEEQARRLTRSGWEEFLDAIERRERFAYTFDQQQVSPLVREIPHASDHELALPIEIAGTNVGKFHFEREQGWSENEKAMVASVSEQVAQQIENLRLLAQAEKYQNEAQEALRRLTREGWETYQDQFSATLGFAYKNHEVKALSDDDDDFENALKFDLQVQDEIIGELGISGVEGLTEDDAEMINYINQQLSAHLENLRLSVQTEQALAETEQQAQRLTLLNNLSEELGRAQTFDDVFRVAGNLLPKIIRADRYSTTRLNENGEFFEVFTLTGMEGAIPTGTQLPVEQTAVGKAIHSRQPVNIPDLRKDSHLEAQPLLDQGLYSTLAVPMIGAQTTIGTLNFGSTQTHGFNDRDQDLAMQAAAQISSVLENRGLLFQTQLQAQREQTLRQITAAVRSSTDPATIMRTAVRELGTALGRNTMIRLADAPITPPEQEIEQ